MQKMQIWLEEEELAAPHEETARSGRSIGELIRDAIRKARLKPGTTRPVAIWGGEPKHTSPEHDSVCADLESESRARTIPLSDVIRERLQRDGETSLEAITDSNGAVDGLPEDLSARKKDCLRAADYGRKRHP